MKAFANRREIVYDLLDKGMKKKSSASKQKRKAKLRQRRKFRAQEKTQLHQLKGE